MLKKILYVIVAITIGFVVFYLSWRDAGSSALVHKANNALKEENFEFFLKFFEIYDKQEIQIKQYTENENTTTIRAYNVYSSTVVVDDTKKNEYAERSGVVLFIYNLNTDAVKLDSEQLSDNIKDEDPATRITFTADNGKTYTSLLSTYGYDSTPIVLFTYFTTEFQDYFKSDTEATKISHIKMVDSESNVFFDSDVDFSFEQHNDKEYWDNLVSEGKAGVAWTNEENRKNFTFSFPEMNKAFLVTGIAILILIGLGVFIFWPKKTYVPQADEDKEKYTFASTEEKEKYALAKVAKGKKEKEDRENRYKNVRTEKTLDEITDEAIEESLDKENTAEAALAMDEELENEALEKVEENELDIETDSADEETKEEE